MADDNVKLPGSSFDEMAKVIQGYADIGKAVPLDEVSRRIGGMHPSVISRNNGFLVFAGILEGGKNKQITPVGKQLAAALSHDIQPEIQRILQEIVEGNDFLRNVVSSVRIRKGMEESALRAHIAYSAGLSKSQSTMTGTGTVLEVLRRAGVLSEQDGKLVATTPSQFSSAQPEHNTLADERIEPAVRRAVVRQLERASGIGVQISVRIDCKPDDLEGLGDRLRKLLDDLERTDGAQSESVRGD